MLGVLGEPWLCEGEREITAWGGWRACRRARRDAAVRRAAAKGVLNGATA